MVEEMNQENALAEIPALVAHRIRDDEAIVNVTWQGQNGDMPDPVERDASDEDIKRMVAEAIAGGVPGIRADRNVDLTDFVVDRIPPTEDYGYNRMFVRPKTPLGADECL
jgi:hypothetical protein